MRNKDNVSRIDGVPFPTFDSNSNDAPIGRWIGADQCPSCHKCPAAVSDDVKLAKVRVDARIVHGIKVVESNVMWCARYQLSTLSGRRDGGLVERDCHAGGQ